MKTLRNIPGRWNVIAALTMLVLAATPKLSADGIPEPSLIMYGVVRVANSGNQRLTSGTLTWTFRSAVRTVTVSAPLTNINDQFSYLLCVPCETEIGTNLASSNVLRLISVSSSYDRSQVAITTDGTVPAALLNPVLTNLAIASQDRGRIERVDLQVSIACVDSDLNGICDYWERQYFGRIGIDPNDDYDGDGLSNHAEFRAGTNPLDPNSRFTFVNVVSEQPAGIRVEWSTVDGTLYSLDRTSDLSGDPMNTVWTTVASAIQAVAPKNTYHDMSATNAVPYFYRLRVEP